MEERSAASRSTRSVPVVFTLVLPLITIVMLWRSARRPFTGWLATFLLALGVTAFSVLVAPWGTFGLPVRYTLVVLFVLALVLSLRRPIPTEVYEESPLRAIVKVLIAFLFGGVAVGVLRAHAVPPGAIDLAFPLRGGTFIIAHGGSTPAANIHHADARQRYAVDITKLGSFGMPVAILNHEVLSPCDGAVVAAVDGNHVIIHCGDVNVTVANLERGSILIQLGANVMKGQPLARVGDSHLRIHAERNGVAVPATLNGEWWVRNELARY
jgi:hypothetical protein